MKLITQTEGVNTVAERWRHQYQRNGEWSVNCTGGAKEIYEKLCALDHSTATAADVEKIIGNGSWAGPQYCGECGATVLVTLSIGHAEHCPQAIQVCESCLVHGLRLLKGHKA